MSKTTDEKLRDKVTRYKKVIVQLIAISVSALLILLVNFLKRDYLEESLKASLTSCLIGVIAGAVISLLDFIFLHDDQKTQKEEALSDILRISKTLNNIAYGVKGVKIYNNRSDINFTKLIEESSKEVSIFLTNLDFMTNHYRTLLDAVRREVNVKILVMKPTNLFVSTRYHELNRRQPNDFYIELKAPLVALLDEIQSQSKKIPNKKYLSIKVYLNQPSHMMFRFDNKLIFTTILSKDRARNIAHIEFDMSEPSLKQITNDLVSNFNLVWREAEDVTDAMIKELPTEYDVSSMEAISVAGETKKYSLL